MNVNHRGIENALSSKTNYLKIMSLEAEYYINNAKQVRPLIMIGLLAIPT